MDTQILIDPRNSRWRNDLRCNSPFCTHTGKVVELFGFFRNQYWCTECGMVSYLEVDFRNRTGPLRLALQKE